MRTYMRERADAIPQAVPRTDETVKKHSAPKYEQGLPFVENISGVHLG